MGKYSALGDFLRQQAASEVALTFERIEKITGTKLPRSARRYRPWWSNNEKNSVMTKVWLEAGFRSEQVDMEGRKLVFRRVASKPQAPATYVPEASKRPAISKNHPLFGALKGTVRIAPGTDLTEPADPDWGELAWGRQD